METVFMIAVCVGILIFSVMLFRRNPRLHLALSVPLGLLLLGGMTIWRAPLDRAGLGKDTHPVTAVVSGNEVEVRGMAFFKRRLVLADTKLPADEAAAEKAKEELAARLKDKKVSIEFINDDSKEAEPWPVVLRLDDEVINASMATGKLLEATGPLAHAGGASAKPNAPTPGWFYWCVLPLVVLAALVVGRILFGQGMAAGPRRAVQKVLPEDPNAARLEVLALLETPEVKTWLKELGHKRRVITPDTPLWIAVLERTCQDVSSGIFRPRRTAALFGRAPLVGAFFHSLVIQEGEFPHTHTLSPTKQEYAYPDEIKPRVHGAMEFLDLPAFLKHAGFPLDERPDAYPQPFLLDVHATIVRGEDGRPRLGTFNFTHELILGEKGETFVLGMLENVSNVIMLKQRPLAPATRQEFVNELAASGRGLLLQIRFCQPHPEAMVPLLDTPITTDRWPELIVAPDGQARLFVQKTAEQADWERLVGKLHELWTATLARFNDGLYDFLSDRNAVEEYMTRKFEILEEFYLIEDLTIDLS